MEQSIILNSLGILELETIIENSVRKVLNEFPIQSTDSSSIKDLLSINEASILLNLAIPTIYGLVSNASIPYMKKGKKLYFSSQELTDWIKSGRRKTNVEKESDQSPLLIKRKNSK